MRQPHPSVNVISLEIVMESTAVTLVKFFAGKLTKQGSSNRVVADARKGVFQIVVTPDEMLTHVQWRPRGVAEAEDTYTIFPGETELVPVQSSPDRVFVLKWKEGSQRLFFWMQTSDPDGDVVLVESVNQVLTDGPNGAQPVVRDPVISSVGGASDAIESASITPPVGRQSITLEALQDAMSGAAGSETHSATPSIGDLLHPDVLTPAFESDAMAGAVPMLLELLPEQECRDVNALTDVLRSPGLKAQAGALTNAIASGGVRGLLSSFGLPCDDSSASTAVGAAGIEVFLRVLKKISEEKKALPE